VDLPAVARKDLGDPLLELPGLDLVHGFGMGGQVLDGLGGNGLNYLDEGVGGSGVRVEGTESLDPF